MLKSGTPDALPPSRPSVPRPRCPKTEAETWQPERQSPPRHHAPCIQIHAQMFCYSNPNRIKIPPERDRDPSCKPLAGPTMHCKSRLQPNQPRSESPTCSHAAHVLPSTLPNRTIKSHSTFRFPPPLAHSREGGGIPVACEVPAKRQPSGLM